MKLSCKDVCFVVSESLDRKLTLRERLSVKVHLLMCEACQRMARQMALLRSASRRLGRLEPHRAHPEEDQVLSQEARQRILKHLQQAGHDHGLPREDK